MIYVYINVLCVDYIYIVRSALYVYISSQECTSIGLTTANV